MALYRQFCERMVPLLKLNIELQLRGGAEVVMIFDTSAGELDPELYTEVVVPSLNKLVYPGKVCYYAKGIQAAHLRHSIFHSDEIAGVGFDHRWDLRDVLRAPRATNGFVQGNFDQSLLFLATESI